MTTITAYFETEAPRFGCGWRKVEVVKKGHKWVRLKYAPLAIGKRQPIFTMYARLPVALWERMARRAR